MGLTSAMRAASFAAMRACVARSWTSSASSAVEVSVSTMAAEVSYLFEDVSFERVMSHPRAKVRTQP
jgi:hypothetical protein